MESDQPSPFRCRALELFKLDESITLALDVAILLRRMFDWYQQIWPCAGVFKRSNDILVGTRDVVSLSDALYSIAPPRDPEVGGKGFGRAEVAVRDDGEVMKAKAQSLFSP